MLSVNILNMLKKEATAMCLLSGFRKECEVMTCLVETLKKESTPLLKSYTLHRCLVQKKEAREKKERSRARNPFKASHAQTVYTAVHSLSLHLQAAMNRLINKRDKPIDTEQLCDTGYRRELFTATVPLLLYCPPHPPTTQRDCLTILRRYIESD